MSNHWKTRRELGGPAITRFFAALCLSLGPGASRWVLFPVCCFFFVVRGEDRRNSRQYLNRVLNHPVRTRDVWRQFWTFAQAALDRAFLLAGHTKNYEMTPVNPEVLHDALDQGKGCILLGSHLGSFEASRHIKRTRPEVQLRLVMDRVINPGATAVLEALNPAMAEQVLDMSEGASAGLRLMQALNEGSLLAILADRSLPGQRTALVDYLGDQAHFPTGPHELGLATGAPMVLFWGFLEGPRRYRIVFEPFPTPVAHSREDRKVAVHNSVQAYAERLAHHASNWPYNWFNFYDFWSSPEPEDQPPSETPLEDSHH